MKGSGPGDVSKARFRVYLEGLGDLVTRLLRGISQATIWVIGVINLLTKSP